MGLKCDWGWRGSWAVHGIGAWVVHGVWCGLLPWWWGCWIGEVGPEYWGLVLDEQPHHPGSRPHHTPCIDAMHHPCTVNPNHILTPPNLGVFRLHDTAAFSFFQIVQIALQNVYWTFIDQWYNDAFNFIANFFFIVKQFYLKITNKF